MPEEFMKRKGYSILPYLPALFENIGDITPKIRLDYAEVVTHLSEERYFKPIFDWHNERGLIYGCDNNGRGLEPLQYLDYFRMISWFTAPGNDAPQKVQASDKQRYPIQLLIYISVPALGWRLFIVWDGIVMVNG